jgi:protein TonB
VIEAPPSELAEKAPATASVDAQAAASDQTRSEAARSSAASAATVAESVSQVDGGALDKYRRALIAATRRYKRYPAIAMEKGWQGKVEVHMVIGADGMLAKTSIKSSSGHKVLDDQAVSMLKKGKSTVQIPPGLRSREFSIDVPVIFNLDDPNF